jgi:hypothetical protein
MAPMSGRAGTETGIEKFTQGNDHKPLKFSDCASQNREAQFVTYIGSYRSHGINNIVLFSNKTQPQSQLNFGEAMLLACRKSRISSGAWDCLAEQKHRYELPILWLPHLAPWPYKIAAFSHDTTERTDPSLSHLLVSSWKQEKTTQLLFSSHNVPSGHIYFDRNPVFPQVSAICHTTFVVAGRVILT